MKLRERAIADNKRLYVIAIDASKAFDKIVRSMMWLRLLDLGTQPTIVLALANYYDTLILPIKKQEGLSKHSEQA